MSDTFFNITGNLNGESKFVAKDLKPIKIKDVVESYTSAAGRTKFRVITPAVQAVVRRHFDCPTLQGAPLADDSEHRSAGSHWDQRLFQGEIMVPVVGEDTVVGRHVITNVTVAMLEDTGWYECIHRTGCGTWTLYFIPDSHSGENVGNSLWAASKLFYSCNVCEWLGSVERRNIPVLCCIVLYACRYVVNYRASGFNHWGYMGGCGFAERSAKEVSASQRSSVRRFTCQRELSVSTECTVDWTSRGVCIADASIDGLTHVKV
jgi:Leishmanolysin